MKKVITIALCLSVFAALLVGCNVKELRYNVDSYNELIVALEGKGYEVTDLDLEEEGFEKHRFFSVYPYTMKIGDGDLWVSVYEFEDEKTAEIEAETISKDGFSIGNSDIS